MINPVTPNAITHGHIVSLSGFIIDETSNMIPKTKGPRNEPKNPIDEYTAIVAPLYSGRLAATTPAVMDDDSPVTVIPYKIQPAITNQKGSNAENPIRHAKTADNNIITVICL